MLEVRDLSIEFPHAEDWQAVVNGLSFDLRPGQVLGLVGESGSGKTLTARALIGLLPGNCRMRGRISLNRQRLDQLSEREWRQWRGRRLAMIFQDPLSALNPVRSIGGQLREVVRRLGAAAAESDLVNLLRRAHLPDPGALLRRYPHQLSGGMRQRVMIAMALSGKPSILLADEPTAALDPTTRSGILAELLRVRDETGCAVILISHDLSVVEQICERLLVMYGGRIMEYGVATDVLQRPHHPYSAALAASRPVFGGPPAGRLPVIPGQFSQADRTRPGCVFAPRCIHAQEVCRHQAPALTRMGQVQVACHFPLDSFSHGR